MLIHATHHTPVLEDLDRSIAIIQTTGKRNNNFGLGVFLHRVVTLFYFSNIPDEKKEVHPSDIIYVGFKQKPEVN